MSFFRPRSAHGILRALSPDRGAVAQFGRAPEWHSGGRQFDPGQLHQAAHRRQTPGTRLRRLRRRYLECSSKPRIEPSTSGGSGGRQPAPRSWSAPGPARGRAGQFDPGQLHQARRLRSARGSAPCGAPARGLPNAVDREPDPQAPLRLPQRESFRSVNFAKLCRVATRSGSSWLTTTRFCTKALLRCSPASTPSPPSVRSSRIARLLQRY